MAKESFRENLLGPNVPKEEEERVCKPPLRRTLLTALCPPSVLLAVLLLLLLHVLLLLLLREEPGGRPPQHLHQPVPPLDPRGNSLPRATRCHPRLVVTLRSTRDTGYTRTWTTKMACSNR